MTVPDGWTLAGIAGIVLFGSTPSSPVSRELTLDEWSQRSRRLKYVDNLMRLTSSLQWPRGVSG